MISTSFMTGTGLKKCMPMTCAGRWVAAASLVMEMELVFEARMASGGRMRSRSRKSCGLDFELFGGGFDGEVAGAEGFEVGGEGDAGAGFVGLLLA